MPSQSKMNGKAVLAAGAGACMLAMSPGFVAPGAPLASERMLRQGVATSAAASSSATAGVASTMAVGGAAMAAGLATASASASRRVKAKGAKAVAVMPRVARQARGGEEDTRVCIPLEDLRNTDVEKVGGKSASLGEMISQLSDVGVPVPGGFSTTSHAYKEFLDKGGINAYINDQLSDESIYTDVDQLMKVGKAIRDKIMDTPFQPDFEEETARASEPRAS